MTEVKCCPLYLQVSTSRFYIFNQFWGSTYSPLPPMEVDDGEGEGTL